MLKCFEPLGSTKPVAAAAAVAAAAEPPSGPAADAAPSQQTLAAALVAFEPAAGRLRFGEPAGAADEGSTHGGGAAATPPTASSAVHVFAPAGFSLYFGHTRIEEGGRAEKRAGTPRAEDRPSAAPYYCTEVHRP